MVEEINGKSFYHVNRINKKNKIHTHDFFQVGNSHTTDKENIFYKATFSNQNNFDWHEHYKTVMQDLRDDSVIFPENIDVFHDSLVYYRSVTQELLFEQIRKEQYNDCPSRKFCLWVAKSITEAEEWYDELKGEKQIVEVELNGVIHTANEEYLFGEELLSLEQMTEKAENYWSGSTGTMEEMKEEILFDGKAKIIRII